MSFFVEIFTACSSVRMKRGTNPERTERGLQLASRNYTPVFPVFSGRSLLGLFLRVDRIPGIAQQVAEHLVRHALGGQDVAVRFHI